MKASKSALKNSLYDSYIRSFRSFRWASDRIEDDGIVAFVSSGSYIDGNTMSGFRQSIVDEFSAIYCFNLRGNARTSGEQRRQEGGNVFDAGSRSPIAITILVKKKEHQGPAIIHYHDIGDYLTNKQKLESISQFTQAQNTPWKIIQPDKHGDWLNFRSKGFEGFIAMSDKENKGKATSKAIFQTFSNGLKTNRDAWVYNFSEKQLKTQVEESINYYYNKVEEYKKNPSQDLSDLMEFDSTKSSWDRQLKKDFSLKKSYQFFDSSIYMASYRPYCKQWSYFHRTLNNCVYKLPDIFPTNKHENLLITIPGIGSKKDFSPLSSNNLCDVQINDNGQCFPLYIYENVDQSANSLGLDWEESTEEYKRSYAITDWAQEQFQQAYGERRISKEDIFYYVYSMLHSPEYATHFANDLKKEMARIPFAKDFEAFSKAGRELADWHLNYETIEPYPLEEIGTNASYRVEKMKFLSKTEKHSIVYNRHIILQGIPYEAHAKSTAKALSHGSLTATASVPTKTAASSMIPISGAPSKKIPATSLSSSNASRASASKAPASSKPFQASRN